MEIDAGRKARKVKSLKSSIQLSKVQLRRMSFSLRNKIKGKVPVMSDRVLRSKKSPLRDQKREAKNVEGDTGLDNTAAIHEHAELEEQSERGQQMKQAMKRIREKSGIRLGSIVRTKVAKKRFDGPPNLEAEIDPRREMYPEGEDDDPEWKPPKLSLATPVRIRYSKRIRQN